MIELIEHLSNYNSRCNWFIGLSENGSEYAQKLFPKTKPRVKAKLFKNELTSPQNYNEITIYNAIAGLFLRVSNKIEKKK